MEEQEIKKTDTANSATNYNFDFINDKWQKNSYDTITANSAKSINK